ncbi:MAG TPA: iron export ABC transporter permease subunit FetB [Abditibacteriaceae bacterium]|jgi:putative ABC transport system permease protein
MDALPLSFNQLALSCGLILLCGLLSVAMRLKLERALFIGTLRTVLQLLLIGYVLKWVFALDSAPLVFGVMAVMIAIAAQAATSRSQRRFSGMMQLSFVSLLLSSFITTFLVTAVIIQVQPWYHAQYAIPLLGMILGNALTGVSLCLDTLLETLSEKRHEIENELALGATSWEAAREPLAAAIRRGMIPQINTMNVIGLVSLPGMMTGQIIAGANPMEAVKYQIVVMFMVATSSMLGCVLMTLLVYKRLFTPRHQLAAHLIEKRR